ncbi:hypothetical protein KGY71_06925 [Candidatus Bipolaricaulota bacterium]|nr:hypothetical protein [Candidatus Bipolaricaulota bacterium]
MRGSNRHYHTERKESNQAHPEFQHVKSGQHIDAVGGTGNPKESKNSG